MSSIFDLLAGDIDRIHGCVTVVNQDQGKGTAVSGVARFRGKQTPERTGRG